MPRHILKLLLLTIVYASPAAAAPVTGGPISPDGKVKVRIDFPQGLRLKNVGGRDGAGLCVFTSIAHAARWQLETPLADFQELMRKENGGGWPQKVDQMIAKYAKGVDYCQYEGRRALVLGAALKSGRLPSVTYNGRDPHYQGIIAHMVNLVHLDETWACILDNNFIGPNDLVWMTPAEFLDRWAGRGSGWCVILLREPPFPSVTQVRAAEQAGRAAGLIPAEEEEPGISWTYQWFYHREDPYRIYLYCLENADNADPVGAYDQKEKYFRYYDSANQAWLGTAEPPFPPPTRYPGSPSGYVGDPIKDYGVPLHQFPPRQPNEENWTRQGKRTTEQEILTILQPVPPPQPLPTPGPQPQPTPRPGPQPSPATPTSPEFYFSILMLILFTAHLLPKERHGNDDHH